MYNILVVFTNQFSFLLGALHKMLISEITAVEKTLSIDGCLVDVAEKNKLISTKYGEQAIIDVVIKDAHQDWVNVTNWCKNEEVAFQKCQTLLVGDVYRIQLLLERKGSTPTKSGSCQLKEPPIATPWMG